MLDGEEQQQAVHVQQWRHELGCPPATRFIVAGMDRAAAAPGVLEAIREADLVLLAPGDPVLSIGIVLGGTQALARSYFSLLIPRGKEAEFFSLYHAMDRGTSWLGTLVFGVVYQLTDSYRPAIFALIAFFLVAANASSFYMIVGYLPSFATRSLELTGLQAFAPSVIALAACLVAEVGGAWLSDRVGRRTVLLTSLVGLLVLAYPSFLLITSGTFGLIACGLVLFGLLAGAYAAVINAALVELFPTRVRVSGHGITYNLSVALFGGSAPYLLTWLGGVTGSTMVGAYYVMILAVVSLPAVLALRETARKPLPG